MSAHRNGRRFAIPRSRRLSWDLLYFNRHVPLCGHDRRMDLSRVAAARQACPTRISWPALFLKAYAQVAQAVPELRQTWYRWPWAHLYQHPSSVGVLTVQRHVGSEPWLFWGHVPQPELQSLPEIQSRIDELRDGPVRDMFRPQRQLARLPMVFRRMVWWWNLNVATHGRAQRIGTFFLSTLAGRGAEIQVPPAVHTGCLTFGPLDAALCSRVTLAYDHRVMDGALVADVLLKLEHVLNHALVDELTAVTVTAASSGIPETARAA